MKLNGFGRFLLALVLIAAIVISFSAIGIAAGIVNAPTAMRLIDNLYSFGVNRLILAGAGVLLLLICILLLFCGRAKQTPNEKAPASTLMQQTEIGGTYIALSAVDAMVQKHCRAISGVRDVQSSLRALDDGVSLGIRLAVVPDTDVAALSAQLQTSLRDYIQSLTGITVKEIGVLVEDAADEPAKRVE